MNPPFRVVRVWNALRSRVPGDHLRAGLTRVVNALLFLLALIAAVSLVAEYGFSLSADMSAVTEAGTLVVLYGFVILGVTKLILAEHRIATARRRWPDLVLLMIILLHLVFPGTIEGVLLSLNPLLSPESLARAYLAAAQLFSVLAFVPTALRYSRRIMSGNIQPSMLILLSFLLLILIGTGLLLLPRATHSGSIAFVDALFTATSAVCVTGLIVVDTATFFTPLGHGILLVLMQIGGLGIMTLTTFFAYVLGGGSRLKEYATMQTLLGEDNLGRIRRTIVTITLTTLAVEAIGAFLLFEFSKGVSAAEGRETFFAIFHAVSGFCNAGFTLTSQNLAGPGLRENIGVLVTIMTLVVVGGIGFPVLSNLGGMFVLRSRNPRPRLTLHSKIVLATTAILIVGGTLGLLMLNRAGNPGSELLSSLFHSISARTAGFNTLDVGTLGPPALFFLMLLMWIGASPGSTGGGVKTTTVALAFLNIRAVASGRNRVEIFGKQVPSIAVVRAFSTALLSFGFISIAQFVLLVSEPFPFESLLFEIVSAMSTVGLSTGITPALSEFGKLVIIVSMIVGRVGLLAAVVALTRKREEGYYEFTHENVLVT